MASHIWNGHTIEVISVATMKGFWFTVALSVRVDRAAVFLGEDSFALGGAVPFQVADRGTIRNGQVVSRIPASILRTSYRIMLEGQEIGRGAARALNWYVPYSILCGPHRDRRRLMCSHTPVESVDRARNLGSALDARTALCLHIERHRSGASESER